jgi:hypothetical protein
LRRVRVLLLAGSLAIATIGFTTGGVAAYGKADQPLAQLEFSGNCNDASFALCQKVGLGGIWLWIEIDGNGTADVAGAGCNHLPGFGGGAGPIRINGIPWTWSSTPQGDPAIFNPNVDPNGYYNLAFGPEVLSFEVSLGHYSAHPVPAVSVNWQTAP